MAKRKEEQIPESKREGAIREKEREGADERDHSREKKEVWVRKGNELNMSERKSGDETRRGEKRNDGGGLTARMQRVGFLLLGGMRTIVFGDKAFFNVLETGRLTKLLDFSRAGLFDGSGWIARMAVGRKSE